MNYRSVMNKLTLSVLALLLSSACSSFQLQPSQVQKRSDLKLRIKPVLLTLDRSELPGYVPNTQAAGVEIEVIF